MTSRTHFDRKEVDDVMGGEEGWKNVDQGEGSSILSPYSDHILTADPHTID
jgi:hypothetical protein